MVARGDSRRRRAERVEPVGVLDDQRRRRRPGARIEAGQVYVNEYPSGGVETPFGGFKKSGYGREKGLEALHHYTQSKTTIVRL